MFYEALAKFSWYFLQCHIWSHLMKILVWYAERCFSRRMDKQRENLAVSVFSAFKLGFFFQKRNRLTLVSRWKWNNNSIDPNHKQKTVFDRTLWKCQPRLFSTGLWTVYIVNGLVSKMAVKIFWMHANFRSSRTNFSGGGLLAKRL